MSCGEAGDVGLGPKNFKMKVGCKPPTCIEDKLKAYGPTKDEKLMELNLSEVPVIEDMGQSLKRRPRGNPDTIGLDCVLLLKVKERVKNEDHKRKRLGR